MSTHSCNKTLRCEKITILLIAPKRCSALHSDACFQAIIIQHDKLTFITSEIQKKNRQGILRRHQERATAKKKGKTEMGLKEEAKKKGKTEMGLKEAAAGAKKKGKMEMGLPQRLGKRKIRE